jgi:biotin transporter BioY
MGSRARFHIQWGPVFGFLLAFVVSPIVAGVVLWLAFK